MISYHKCSFWYGSIPMYLLCLDPGLSSKVNVLSVVLALHKY